jgi:hypothetical protein
MRLNRTFLTTGVLCGLGLAVVQLAGAPQAIKPTGAFPSGDQILAKYEEALGGAAALNKVMTRTVKSRRIVDIGTPSDHVLTRYSKRGNFSIMFHAALDETFLYYLNGCDGKTGWQRGGGGEGGGAAAAPGGARAGGRGAAAVPVEEGAVRSADTTTGGICEEESAYYGYFVFERERMRSHYSSVDVKLETKLVPTEPGPNGVLAGGGKELNLSGVRDVYVVLATPNHKPDPFVWLYFDKATGALLRRAEAGAGAAPIAMGDATRYTDFIQYRAVGDGTVSPFQFITVGAGAARVRGIHFSIVDNTPMDDKLLARPKNAMRFDKGL